MQITEVTPMGKRRLRIRTDAGFAFALYGEEARRYRIEAGTELSAETYAEIRDRILCPRARERALYLLEARERTEQELRRKLHECAYPPEVIERTMVFLREYGLADDQEYGRRYVEVYGARRSTRRIRQELLRKGLPSTQIADLLEGLEEGEPAQILDYLHRQGYDPETVQPEQKQKLLRALLRKGYSYETAARTMEGYPR